MGRHEFRFKQFAIEQDQCSMKVCTDACLFGAWVAELVRDMANDEKNPVKINTILDIGSGTGLLALMLAQKSEALIDGIEINANACAQANENKERSMWASRIRIICGDVKQFTSNRQYDLVMCNPPFYENSLQSPDASANLARHEAGLKLEELAGKATENLGGSGFFAILLPYPRLAECIKTASGFGLHVMRQVNVKQTRAHSHFRVMLLFGRTYKSDVQLVDMAIRNEGAYTLEFTDLLKDYYLYL